MLRHEARPRVQARVMTSQKMPSTIAPTKRIDAYAATTLKGPTMVMGSSLGSTLAVIGPQSAGVTPKASKTFPLQKVSLAVAPVDESAPPSPTWLKNIE